MLEGSPRDAHQRIDGNAFRMRLQGSQLVKKADAVGIFLAHAENSAAADGDARFANCRECAEPLVVNARGDD